MKISELIEKLGVMMADYGDVQVEVMNVAGEFDVAESVSATSHGWPGAQRWTVFIVP